MFRRPRTTRKEKIKLLQAVKEGKLTIESLQPPQVYIFMQKSNNPGVYEMNGKEFNEQEYSDFCERVKQRNRSYVIWDELKEYSQENKIITLRIAQGCEPLKNSLTLIMDKNRI